MMEHQAPTLTKDGGARAARSLMRFEPAPALQPQPAVDYQALYHHARDESDKSWTLLKDMEAGVRLERCMNQDLWNLLTITPKFDPSTVSGKGEGNMGQPRARDGADGDDGVEVERVGGGDSDSDTDSEAPELPGAERYLRWLQRRSERLVLENTRIFDKLDCLEIAKSQLAEKLRFTELELKQTRQSRDHLAEQLEERHTASEQDWIREVEKRQELEKERELHTARTAELMSAKSRIRALEREVRLREDRVDQFHRICTYFRSQLVLMPFVDHEDEKLMHLLKLEADRRKEKADRFIRDNAFAYRPTPPKAKGCWKATKASAARADGAGGPADERETAMEIDDMAKGAWKEKAVEKRVGPPPMGPPQPQPPTAKRAKAEYVVDATAKEPFKKPTLPQLPPPNRPTKAKKVLKKAGGEEDTHSAEMRDAAEKMRGTEVELRKKAAKATSYVMAGLGMGKEAAEWRKAAREAKAAKEAEERGDREQQQKDWARLRALEGGKREGGKAPASQVVPDGDVDLFPAGESGVMIYETDEDEQGKQASDATVSDDGEDQIG